jgi:hypothetical protein
MERDEFHYFIEDKQWVYPRSNFSCDKLGACVSYDYKLLGLTLHRHGGISTTYKDYQKLSKILEGLETFEFLVLEPTQVNCDNINKMIDVSLLSISFLDKMIKDNNKDLNINRN